MTGRVAVAIAGRPAGTGLRETPGGTESLADRAARVADDDPVTAHALYKGSLGVALLAAELDRPLEARMPLFEHEGWPERV